MSASSRALTCADILQEVISQAVPLKKCESREDRLLLARLARLCKSSNHVASKVLWACIPSMLPLLHLLSVFRYDPEASESTHMIVGPVSAREWDRFRYHAAFVTELGYDGSWMIAPFIWVYLERLSKNLPLLPSLRRLRWPVRSCSATELLHLVSPLLEHLTIEYDYSATQASEWEDANMYALLRQVFSLAPWITRLSVFTRDLRDSFAEHASLLEVLPRLRELELHQEDGATGLATEVLLVLSRLQAVDTLSLHVDLWDEPFPVFQGFNQLRKLAVSTTYQGGMHKFLPICNPNSLRELEINQTREREEADLVATSAAVAKFLALTKLAWNIHAHRCMHTSASVTSILNPLASLRCLQDVSIKLDEHDVSNPDVVSDALLCTLAEAWPRLQRFTMIWESAPHNTESLVNTVHPPFISSPTTTALAAFAAHCPKLELLFLAGLFVPETTLDEVTALPLSNHPLRLFSGYLLRSDDPRMAALVLDRLFPAIDIEDSRRVVPDGTTPNDEYPCMWTNIKAPLELCRMARLTRPHATAP